ncbi:MAG: methyltransferase domain-containing protein [Nocardiopsaceae bacterium]|jgi:SAM-dependent methyltransferase|nr:methyltransferase domain-containing protein [Nocardiopsaceae bacterium]
MTTHDGASSQRNQTIARYSALAREAIAGATITDCEPGTFADGEFGAAGYSDSDVPEPALRASLGCGNPVAVADLQSGETVLDLGSGGGLDVLLSARRVGPAGLAYGLDGSEDMLALASSNAARADVSNVRFLLGHIEEIPLPDDHIDVIISNCVLNLSANKPRVLAEAFRVLRPGGRLGISDVIADSGLDPQQRTEAENQVGCTSGTLTRAEYEGMLARAGFASASVTVTNDAGCGLHSAIVRAVKPAES